LRRGYYKRVEIVIDDYLYEFYKKIGASVAVPTKKVIADSLLKFAGGLSQSLSKNTSPKK
jgi:hypothetical protein